MKLPDSGQREEYGTGAQRDTSTGKGRFDLLPPFAMQRLARHFENGAAKYEDRNWEHGIPLHRFYDSAMRHLTKLAQGSADEDHLAATAWNIMCLMDTQARIEAGLAPRELDDLPDYWRGKSVGLHDESTESVEPPHVADPEDVYSVTFELKNCEMFFDEYPTWCPTCKYLKGGPTCRVCYPSPVIGAAPSHWEVGRTN